MSGRPRWPLLKEKVPLLVVTLGRGAIIVASGVAARVVVAYHLLTTLGRSIWPASPSPPYEIPARISLLELRSGLALAATILPAAVLIGLRRRWPGGPAAGAFSALLLAPTSLTGRMGADLSPNRYPYRSGLGFAVPTGGARSA